MFARTVTWLVILLALGAAAAFVRVPGVGPVSGVLLDVVAPIQELVFGGYRETTGRSLATVEELVLENQRLRAENERLTQEAIQAPELARENEELRELLGLRKAGQNWQWLEARVIGFDATNLVRSATLNRGGREGIVDGMTVMTGRGLVGRIVKLSPTASRVLLLTDPSSSVNAMVQRSRARGVLYGQRGPAGSNQTIMKFIPQGEEIRAGDRVITSGLGGIFPEGIAIGQVAQVRQRDTDMFQEALIEPYVDLTRLEEAFVVMNHLPVQLD